MKWLKKLDDNLLKGLLAFFIFFIPLYPKFPFQIVNFTYIAIRFDDFLAAIIGFVFVTDLIRGKIEWSKLKFKKEIFVFWVSVFLAFLSGMYLTKTIDYPFVGFLHAARRVEYMMLFFIAMATVKTVNDFKLYLYCLLASLSLVLSYGIGQRMYGFPAVSTMNPEFAKGRVLFLTPEARLSSTFAGHYDLGAYLVFFFPLLWGTLVYGKELVKSKLEKAFVFCAGMAPIVFTMYSLGRAIYSGTTLTILMTTLSQRDNAMIVLSMAATLIIFMLAYHYKLTRKVLFFVLAVLGVVVIIATASRTSSIAFIVSTLAFLLFIRKFWYALFIFILFGWFTYYDTDLVQRWLQTIQVRQIIINEKTGEEVVVQKIRSDELPAGTSFINFGKSDESTLAAQIKEDLAIKQASLGGGLNPQDYQTYNAVAADISLAVRFQVSWPRAWQAFLRNPLLGTGPSSITESSDGDYMRWIGEMGALGTGTFLFALASIFYYLWKSRTRLPKEAQMLVWAVLFGAGGLFINAVLIDVFEASKVAYLFWLTLGMFVGLMNIEDSELKKL